MNPPNIGTMSTHGTLSTGNFTPESNTPTQAADLTAQIDEKLDATIRLKGRENYDIWTTFIIGILELYRLDKLIDSSLPRPQLNDPKYDIWYRCSITIKNWIMVHTEHDIIEKVQTSGKPFRYADEIWDTLKNVVKGSGTNLRYTTWRDATFCKRDNYGTISQFITAFKRLVRDSNQMDMVITPYMATIILLQELEAELPVWTMNVKLSLPKDKGRDVDLNTFQQTCTEAEDEGSRLERQLLSTPATSRLTQRETSSSRPRRNAPPNGKKPEDWVKEWKDRERQQTSAGKCVYCGGTGHGPKTCFYLNPQIRPPGWRIRQRDLWCYFKNQNASSNTSQQPSQTATQQVSQASGNETKNTTASELPAKSSLAQDVYHRTLYEDDDDDFVAYSTMARPYESQTSKKWIADSGSAHHICGDMNAFLEYTPFEKDEYGYRYETSEGVVARAEGKGKTLIRLKLDNGKTTDLVVNCFYKPNLSCNLFSTELSKKTLGIYHNSKNNFMQRVDNDDVVGYVYIKGGVPYLQTKEEDVYPQMATLDAMLVHRRLGHCGTPKLKTAMKQTDYADDSLVDTDLNCEPCKIGKAKQQISREPQARSKVAGEFFHCDLQIMTPTGILFANYLLTIIDDATRHKWVYHTRTKKEASLKLIEFNKMILNTCGKYPRRWRMDGGKEFFTFRHWATNEGVLIEEAPPRTHEPNGAIERNGGYIMCIGRTMIIDSKLPEKLWPLATETAAYIVNRLIPPGEEKSPLERWNNQINPGRPKPTLKHLRVFGCKAYVHIPKEDRVQSQKVAPRAWIGRLVGYGSENGHIYKVWIPEKGTIKSSRDVTFNEDDVYQPPSSLPKRPPPPVNEGEAVRVKGQGSQKEIQKTTDMRITVPIHETVEQHQQETITGRIQTLSPTPMLTGDGGNEDATVHNSNSPPAIRRSARSNKGREPTRYIDEIAKTMSTIPAKTLRAYQVKLPNTYTEAMASSFADQWYAAMKIQIDKLTKKHTWDLVPRPRDPETQILPGKWVFDLKCDANDFVLEFRARWVVCGNFQKGLDHGDTYSPVVNEVAVKIALTMIAKKNLECEQVDMVTAYLNAEMKNKRVFMRQPTGFQTDSNVVCLLLQALYGLRESAFLWNKLFTVEIKKLGFTPLLEDSCVFLRGDDILILYVDDSLIAAKTKGEIKGYIEGIKKSFGIKELGEPSRFLGCKITRDREKRTITLSQCHYVQKIINQMNMNSLSPVMTPMEATRVPKKGDDKPDEERVEIYRKWMGKINWLSIRTRPDITFATARLQRYAANPLEEHLNAAKRIFRYLKSHDSYGIVLGQDPTQNLCGYVDASHADCEGGKSTEAYVFLLAGAPISWASKKQSLVAPSSTIAEYCALDRVTKEAIWLRKLVVAMGLEKMVPTPIFTDSANAISIIRKQGYTPATRWIDNKYFFVKNAVLEGHVTFKHIDGNLNPADGLTKALERVKFEEHLNLVRMKKLEIINTEMDESDSE
jgi:hypothetical protein